MNHVFQTLPKTHRGERYYLISYDCPSDKLRAKLGSACLDAGLFRVQLSHFAGCISDSTAQRLLVKLLELSLPEASSSTTSSLGEQSNQEPLANIMMYRLDQGQGWFALNRPSPVTPITPPEKALRPKRFDDYIIRSDD